MLDFSPSFPMETEGMPQTRVKASKGTAHGDWDACKGLAGTRWDTRGEGTEGVLELRYVPWSLGGGLNMEPSVSFLPKGYGRPEAGALCLG